VNIIDSFIMDSDKRIVPSLFPSIQDIRGFLSSSASSSSCPSIMFSNIYRNAYHILSKTIDIESGDYLNPEMFHLRQQSVNNTSAKFLQIVCNIISALFLNDTSIFGDLQFLTERDFFIDIIREGMGFNQFCMTLLFMMNKVFIQKRSSKLNNFVKPEFFPQISSICHYLIKLAPQFRILKRSQYLGKSMRIILSNLDISNFRKNTDPYSNSVVVFLPRSSVTIFDIMFITAAPNSKQMSLRNAYLGKSNKRIIPQNFVKICQTILYEIDLLGQKLSQRIDNFVAKSIKIEEDSEANPGLNFESIVPSRSLLFPIFNNECQPDHSLESEDCSIFIQSPIPRPCLLTMVLFKPEYFDCFRSCIESSFDIIQRKLYFMAIYKQLHQNQLMGIFFNKLDKKKVSSLKHAICACEANRRNQPDCELISEWNRLFTIAKQENSVDTWDKIMYSEKDDTSSLERTKSRMKRIRDILEIVHNSFREVFGPRIDLDSIHDEWLKYINDFTLGVQNRIEEAAIEEEKNQFVSDFFQLQKKCKKNAKGKGSNWQDFEGMAHNLDLLIKQLRDPDFEVDASEIKIEYQYQLKYFEQLCELHKFEAPMLLSEGKRKIPDCWQFIIDVVTKGIKYQPLKEKRFFNHEFLQFVSFYLRHVARVVDQVRKQLGTSGKHQIIVSQFINYVQSSFKEPSKSIISEVNFKKGCGIFLRIVSLPFMGRNPDMLAQLLEAFVTWVDILCVKNFKNYIGRVKGFGWMIYKDGSPRPVYDFLSRSLFAQACIEFVYSNLDILPIEVLNSPAGITLPFNIPNKKNVGILVSMFENCNERESFMPDEKTFLISCIDIDYESLDQFYEDIMDSGLTIVPISSPKPSKASKSDKKSAETYSISELWSIFRSVSEGLIPDLAHYNAVFVYLSKKYSPGLSPSFETFLKPTISASSSTDNFTGISILPLILSKQIAKFGVKELEKIKADFNLDHMFNGLCSHQRDKSIKNLMQHIAATYILNCVQAKNRTSLNNELSVIALTAGENADTSCREYQVYTMIIDSFSNVLVTHVEEVLNCVEDIWRLEREIEKLLKKILNEMIEKVMELFEDLSLLYSCGLNLDDKFMCFVYPRFYASMVKNEMYALVSAAFKVGLDKKESEVADLKSRMDDWKTKVMAWVKEIQDVSNLRAKDAYSQEMKRYNEERKQFDRVLGKEKLEATANGYLRTIYRMIGETGPAKCYIYYDSSVPEVDGFRCEGKKIFVSPFFSLCPKKEHLKYQVKGRLNFVRFDFDVTGITDEVLEIKIVSSSSLLNSWGFQRSVYNEFKVHNLNVSAKQKKVSILVPIFGDYLKNDYSTNVTGRSGKYHLLCVNGLHYYLTKRSGVSIKMVSLNYLSKTKMTPEPVKPKIDFFDLVTEFYRSTNTREFVTKIRQGISQKILCSDGVKTTLQLSDGYTIEKEYSKGSLDLEQLKRSKKSVDGLMSKNDNFNSRWFKTPKISLRRERTEFYGLSSFEKVDLLSIGISKGEFSCSDISVYLSPFIPQDYSHSIRPYSLHIRGMIPYDCYIQVVSPVDCSLEIDAKRGSNGLMIDIFSFKSVTTPKEISEEHCVQLIHQSSNRLISQLVMKISTALLPNAIHICVPETCRIDGSVVHFNPSLDRSALFFERPAGFPKLKDIFQVVTEPGNEASDKHSVTMKDGLVLTNWLMSIQSGTNICGSLKLYTRDISVRITKAHIYNAPGPILVYIAEDKKPQRFKFFVMRSSEFEKECVFTIGNTGTTPLSGPVSVQCIPPHQDKFEISVWDGDKMGMNVDIPPDSIANRGFILKYKRSPTHSFYGDKFYVMVGDTPCGLISMSSLKNFSPDPYHCARIGHAIRQMKVISPDMINLFKPIHRGIETTNRLKPYVFSGGSLATHVYFVNGSVVSDSEFSGFEIPKIPTFVKTGETSHLKPPLERVDEIINAISQINASSTLNELFDLVDMISSFHMDINLYISLGKRVDKVSRTQTGLYSFDDIKQMLGFAETLYFCSLDGLPMFITDKLYELTKTTIQNTLHSMRSLTYQRHKDVSRLIHNECSQYFAEEKTWYPECQSFIEGEDHDMVGSDGTSHSPASSSNPSGVSLAHQQNLQRYANQNRAHGFTNLLHQGAKYVQQRQDSGPKVRFNHQHTDPHAYDEHGHTTRRKIETATAKPVMVLTQTNGLGVARVHKVSESAKQQCLEQMTRIIGLDDAMKLTSRRDGEEEEEEEHLGRNALSALGRDVKRVDAKYATDLRFRAKIERNVDEMYLFLKNNLDTMKVGSLEETRIMQDFVEKVVIEAKGSYGASKYVNLKEFSSKYEEWITDLHINKICSFCYSRRIVDNLMTQVGLQFRKYQGVPQHPVVLLVDIEEHVKPVKNSVIVFVVAICLMLNSFKIPYSIVTFGTRQSQRLVKSLKDPHSIVALQRFIDAFVMNDMSFPLDVFPFASYMCGFEEEEKNAKYLMISPGMSVQFFSAVAAPKDQRWGEVVENCNGSRLGILFIDLFSDEDNCKSFQNSLIVRKESLHNNVFFKMVKGTKFTEAMDNQFSDHSNTDSTYNRLSTFIVQLLEVGEFDNEKIASIEQMTAQSVVEKSVSLEKRIMPVIEEENEVISRIKQERDDMFSQVMSFEIFVKNKEMSGGTRPFLKSEHITMIPKSQLQEVSVE
ncbi:hypothetical protein ADUPG1_009094, partial [Aduncisulcus paluster]